MWGILSHYACVNSSVPANSRVICLSSLLAEPITHMIEKLKSRDDILTDTLAELQLPCYNLISLDKRQLVYLPSSYITFKQHQQQEEWRATLPHPNSCTNSPPQTFLHQPHCNIRKPFNCFLIALLLPFYFLFQIYI